ncbi:DNA gyrase inhibitor YacG [Sulfurimicrobium lacus]|uniref:DNA gyrase inhibitor YacG n=1 Tax=Sulfurimicrobium lacus TaxID=2715678 RepID=UPI0015639C51
MSSQPSTPRIVHCPTCGEAAPYSTSNPYRPFCSRRCKLIDLGQWANEEFRIPEAEKPLPDSE